jgi:aryl-alcohol dehydrogenase-like predicted oxidoreductase
MVVEKRTLGTQGVIVSELGLGCMGMSDFYAGRDDAESVRTIHAALEGGVTMLDTADAYGRGTNEELVGRALREWKGGRREMVVVATKFGNVRAADGSFLGVRGDAKYVKECCEASLRRLGMETIDLYYQHRVDTKVPIEETIGAMKELVEAGKVKHLGMSEAAPATLRRAAAVHPIAALQTEYSLWTRDVEDGILQACREVGTGFVAYSPLGRGFLTGQIKRYEDLAEDDYRRHSPRFVGENFGKNLELVRKIEELAKGKGCTATQLALAWVLAQGKDIVAIPGTKRVKYLKENLEAVLVTLSEEELRAIDGIAPKGVAAGMRYAEKAMGAVGK